MKLLKAVVMYVLFFKIGWLIGATSGSLLVTVVAAYVLAPISGMGASTRNSNLRSISWRQFGIAVLLGCVFAAVYLVSAGSVIVAVIGAIVQLGWIVVCLVKGA
ncbi:hypothetical protein BH10CYA1_BH10CYA1_18190 [soil metagenome]